MNKNDFKKIKLSKGIVDVYNFNSIKLHAYKTNDFIDDEVFVIEKNKKAVIIESPCFFYNNKELEEYLSTNNISAEALLLSYHMAGGSFLKNVKKYATKNADEYGHNGGGKQLINNFTSAFGKIFDNSIHKITDYIEEGKIKIADIEFIIIKTNEAFDIEMPEINTVYTHMLGHDCHSIVAGDLHANIILKQLKQYLVKGYNLILTSHYTPEDLKDVEIKIAYIEDLKQIAKVSKDAQDFKNKCKEKYQKYSGENYLNMTANFFFSK